MIVPFVCRQLYQPEYPTQFGGNYHQGEVYPPNYLRLPDLQYPARPGDLYPDPRSHDPEEEEEEEARLEEKRYKGGEDRGEEEDGGGDEDLLMKKVDHDTKEKPEVKGKTNKLCESSFL